jgi:hypothetical protein
VVTSVLQTTAGKMIFGRYIDAGAPAQAATASAQNGQAQAPVPVPAERTAKASPSHAPQQT